MQTCSESSVNLGEILHSFHIFVPRKQPWLLCHTQRLEKYLLVSCGFLGPDSASGSGLSGAHWHTFLTNLSILINLQFPDLKQRDAQQWEESGSVLLFCSVSSLLFCSVSSHNAQTCSRHTTLRSCCSSKTSMAQPGQPPASQPIHESMIARIQHSCALGSKILLPMLLSILVVSSMVHQTLSLSWCRPGLYLLLLPVATAHISWLVSPLLPCRILPTNWISST